MKAIFPVILFMILQITIVFGKPVNTNKNPLHIPLSGEWKYIINDNN